MVDILMPVDLAALRTVGRPDLAAAADEIEALRVRLATALRDADALRVERDDFRLTAQRTTAALALVDAALGGTPFGPRAVAIANWIAVAESATHERDRWKAMAAETIESRNRIAEEFTRYQSTHAAVVRIMPPVTRPPISLPTEPCGRCWTEDGAEHQCDRPDGHTGPCAQANGE